MTKEPKAKDRSRADDDLRQSILSRYRRGESVAKISKDLGLSTSFANVTIARIRDADMAESGEPTAVVMAAYPRQRCAGATA